LNAELWCRLGRLSID
jgi:hypothetical protein